MIYCYFFKTFPNLYAILGKFPSLFRENPLHSPCFLPNFADEKINKLSNILNNKTI